MSMEGKRSPGKKTRFIRGGYAEQAQRILSRYRNSKTEQTEQLILFILQMFREGCFYNLSCQLIKPLEQFVQVIISADKVYQLQLERGHVIQISGWFASN